MRPLTRSRMTRSLALVVCTWLGSAAKTHTREENEAKTQKKRNENGGGKKEKRKGGGEWARSRRRELHTRHGAASQSHLFVAIPHRIPEADSGNTK